MKRKRVVGTLIGLFLGTASQAQDPSIPMAPAGEEVFGEGYMPTAPAEEAVALEPGRPGAGFEFTSDGGAMSLPSNLGDRTRLRLPGAEAIGIPLLRNVRRENRLQRKRARASAEETLFTADASAPELKVHFVNVGQGAGAILEFPCHTALIDTGGEYATGQGTVDGGKIFSEYLDRFFDQRPERNRVIDLVVTSHPHQDHLAGLKHIMGATGANSYKVRNVVDNGQTHDKGSLQEQKAFRAWAVSQTPKARYSYVNFKSAVTATGVTNSVIDPIDDCRGVDPVITIFWGAYNEKIVTGGEDWLNPNNHSLVVRVDYGEASLLFVGDLEDVGAKEMLREYEDNLGAFDVDVYHISHHGAGNDTFDSFVEAMSPEYAILSMGTTEARVPHTAWAYGHPRKRAIDVLQNQPAVVSRTRPAKSVQVAPSARKFEAASIKRAIYGTGWEGTVVLAARPDGAIRIATE